jgi:hypothetical protein
MAFEFLGKVEICKVQFSASDCFIERDLEDHDTRIGSTLLS